jgi:prophage tail gpP-like protein
VRLVQDAAGNLIITRTGTRLAKAVLRLGDNIERASANFSCRERFSEYLVVGKDNDFTFDDAAQTAHVKASARDAGVRRYRPVLIVADDDGVQMDCQAHADWQRNTHYGRNRGIVYTVRGWRETPGGDIWAPNTRVRVVDGYMGIDGEMIIAEVRLSVGSEGKYTQLQVMPKEAMERVELPEPTDPEDSL